MLFDKRMTQVMSDHKQKKKMNDNRYLILFINSKLDFKRGI